MEAAASTASALDSRVSSVNVSLNEQLRQALDSIATNSDAMAAMASSQQAQQANITTLQSDVVAANAATNDIRTQLTQLAACLQQVCPCLPLLPSLEQA